MADQPQTPTAPAVLLKGQMMLTRNRKILVTTLVLAGAMSIGAVATAQAHNGSPSSSDDYPAGIMIAPTPTPTPSPSLDDDGLRGDGSIDDNSGTTPTPAPVVPNGLPTDADHPQGDDSIGRPDGGHGSDDDTDAEDSRHGDDDDSDDNSGPGGNDDGGGDDDSDDYSNDDDDSDDDDDSGHGDDD